MATTSNQIQVNKEAIRILVADIGYTRTSERTGIKRDTLYKWGQRKGWKEPVKHAQALTVQSVQSIGDIHASELADNECKTKLSLSRYARRAAEHSESATLRDSPYVKQVAQTAAIVHRWDAKEQQGNTVVNIALLGVDPASVSVDVPPTIDVDPVGSE